MGIRVNGSNPMVRGVHPNQVARIDDVVPGRILRIRNRILIKLYDVVD
jgi:hypothetical protein